MLNFIKKFIHKNFHKKNNDQKRLENFVIPLLNLSPQEYINNMHTFVTEMDNSLKAMIVVAYVNLIPMLSATLLDNPDPQDKEMPRNLNEMIVFLAKHASVEDNIIAERRFGWFLWASLIIKASVILFKDLRFSEDLAKIWQELLYAAEYIPILLEKNIVWSKEEKAWFADCKNKKETQQYVFEFVMPAPLLQTQAIKNYKENHMTEYFEGFPFSNFNLNDKVIKRLAEK